MDAKSDQKKTINKKLQQFLKEQSEELRSELLKADYLPVLSGMWKKLPPAKMDAAIKLLVVDGSTGAIERLRSISTDACNPLVARLAALDALGKLGKDIGDDTIKSKLNEMRRVAVENDSAAAGDLAKSLSPLEIEAWATVLVENRASKVIVAVGEAVQDKQSQKAMRRAAHELRAKGVDVPQWGEKGESVLKPPEKEESLALCGIPDGEGKQFLVMFLYEEMEAVGGAHVVNAILDPKNGFDDYQAVDATRSSARSFLKKLNQPADKNLLFKLPVDHAAYLLDRAAARAAERGLPTPPEYPHTRNHLPKSAQPYVPPDPKSLIHGEIALRDSLDAVGLLKSQWFANWIPDTDSLNLCKMKLDQALTSALVITESQRLQQVEKSFEDSAKAFLTPEKRLKLSEKLLEAARLFAWNVMEKQAMWAIAVAEEVSKADVAPHFVIEMFRRAFPDIQDAIKKGSFSAPKEEKPPPAGGIIIP